MRQCEAERNVRGRRREREPLRDDAQLTGSWRDGARPPGPGCCQDAGASVLDMWIFFSPPKPTLRWARLRNEVHGDVPDDVPDPDDSDPAALDGANVGEAPVTGRNAELVLEEGGLVDDGEERQSRGNLVQTVERAAEEELGQVPVLGLEGGLDSVERQGHDGTVVEEGDDKNHEGREVRLPDEGEQSETDDDTDDTGETIDVEDHLVERLVRAAGGEDTINENLGVEHAVTKTKTGDRGSRVEDEDLEDDEQTNGDHAEQTDAG
ncbi:hypothetical protein L1887_52856 [Cichorium endivia]|nr:hypothetical protein L1887_52856 [Cichorium endivia]